MPKDTFRDFSEFAAACRQALDGGEIDNHLIECAQEARSTAAGFKVEKDFADLRRQSSEMVAKSLSPHEIAELFERPV